MKKSLSVIVLGMTAWISASVQAAADTPPSNPATAEELPQVLVIGNVPLQGFGLPLNQVPADVQTATSADLQRQQSLDVADYMNNNFSGVNVSDSVGNPFQLDVYYHGFAASQLIGAPEGLSVYVDGVRVNESFGDTVNWDLIPEQAISTITLISGSNPVFGLNTLGGALSLRTKSGHDDAGTEIEAYVGSFGRRSVQAETGGSAGPFDWFFAGNYFDETGWRDVSNSRVWQGFGKLGWQTDETDIDLSYTYADTYLYGDGTTPLSMLDYRREQTYTPDYTQNIMHFVNLTGTQSLTDHLLFSGNAFYRKVDTFVQNGNINGSYLESNYAGPPTDCTDPGANPATLAYCTPGQDANSIETQQSYGFGLQLTQSDELVGLKNQGVFGIDYMNARDTYDQVFLYGGIAPDHTLIYEASPYNDQLTNALSGSNRIFGAYFTDTLSPSDLVHVTAAVRYNLNHETLDGVLIDTDPADFGNGFLSSTPVTGDHSFARVNPSIGLTLTPTEIATYYANYNEASRAPTVIELGCSDPSLPCGTPNDFSGDPDLKQVVARTFEIGLRGNLPAESLNWSADLFRTMNSNDIQFISTAVSSGYFANVGSTRRQGLDVSIGGKEVGLSWKLAYSRIDATYRSTFLVGSSSNSQADANGNISVRPGDRIPLIAPNMARLVLDYAFDQHLDVGANLIFASGSYLHGDENNANVANTTDPATGAYVTRNGSGTIPSYLLLNFNATYRCMKNLEIFARLMNALNKDYYTAGFLTQSAYNPNGTFIANPNGWTNENAVVPGAPRQIWGGVRLRF